MFKKLLVSILLAVIFAFPAHTEAIMDLYYDYEAMLMGYTVFNDYYERVEVIDGTEWIFRVDKEAWRGHPDEDRIHSIWDWQKRRVRTVLE